VILTNIPRVVDISYLNVLSSVFNEGTLEKDRTSVGSSVQEFAKEIHFDTKGRYVPFIQHRSFGVKTSFTEFIWMMRGETDANILRKQDVHIWDDHTTREFLDSRGLNNLPVGSVGKSYGYQLRSFGGGVDQLEKTINNLKSDDGKTSKRHVISLWNPNELDDAPLEPCAYLYEFMVQGNTLHLHQHMRSADILYGVPYNMGFATYLLFAMAKVAGLQAGRYWLTMTNCHIYSNQLKLAEQIIEKGINKLTPCPMMTLKKDIRTIKDFENLTFKDFDIQDFVKGDPIKKVPIAV